MPRSFTKFLFLLLLLLGFASSLSAQVREESEVKAAYIYNFAHFVDWPAAAFTNKSEPLIVAVLGEDPFGANLDKALQKQHVKGRPFHILKVATGEPVPRCHILFIGLSEKDRLSAIIAEVKSKPVLTVSEINPFAQFGGMIRFSRERRKIGLVVNPSVARAAGLRINPELLAIATIRNK